MKGCSKANCPVDLVKWTRLIKVSRPAVQVIAYWIKNQNGSNQGLNWKYIFNGELLDTGLRQFTLIGKFQRCELDRSS